MHPEFIQDYLFLVNQIARDTVFPIVLVLVEMTIRYPRKHGNDF